MKKINFYLCILIAGAEALQSQPGTPSRHFDGVEEIVLSSAGDQDD